MSSSGWNAAVRVAVERQDTHGYHELASLENNGRG